MSRLALSRCSGGIEGRPRLEYMRLNTGERLARAPPPIGVFVPLGGGRRAPWSGVMNTITAACSVSSPRIKSLPAAPPAPSYETRDQPSIPLTSPFFSTLLGEWRQAPRGGRGRRSLRCARDGRPRRRRNSGGRRLLARWLPNCAA